MAVRKKVARGATTMRSSGTGEDAMIGVLERNTEILHRNTVLLEDVQANQRAMAEVMIAMEARLTRDFNARFESVDVRLSDLESAVRAHSKESRALEASVGRLEAKVEELQKEIRQLRSDFEKREEVARIASLEVRVAELERIVKTG
jgi:septal ring factor EnvC (AmiA/AmiB activator)